MGRAALALLTVTALLLAAGCGGDEKESGIAAAGELADVSSVDVVADAFDADIGTPRLVLLLSPT